MRSKFFQQQVIMAACLEDKVRRLLDLLDEVERGFQEEPESIQPNLALHLLERLEAVADVVADQYEEEGVRVGVAQRQPARVQDDDQDQLPDGAAARPSIPSQRPIPARADSSANIPPPPQPPAADHLSPMASYSQLGKRSRTWELDEAERKRRREAEQMVQSLSRPTQSSCGVQYTGDQQEKRFSDDAKEKIRKRLPALKNHKHLFHYMVWATLERLDCDHCRQCPNSFQIS